MQATKDYGFVRKPELRHQLWYAPQPSRTSDIWVEEHGVIPVNRLAKGRGYSTCSPTISRLRPLGLSTLNKQKSVCLLFGTRLREKQPWTNDRTEHQHK